MSGLSKVSFIWQGRLHMYTAIVTTKHKNGKTTKRKEIRYEYHDQFFKQEGNSDLPDKDREFNSIAEDIKKNSGITQKKILLTILLILFGIVFIIVGLGVSWPSNIKDIANYVGLGIGIVLIVTGGIIGKLNTPYGTSTTVGMIKKYLEKNRNHWEVTLIQLGYELSWKLEEKEKTLTEYDQFKRHNVTYKGYWPHLELYFTPASLGGRGMGMDSSVHPMNPQWKGNTNMNFNGMNMNGYNVPPQQMDATNGGVNGGVQMNGNMPNPPPNQMVVQNGSQYPGMRPPMRPNPANVGGAQIMPVQNPNNQIMPVQNTNIQEMGGDANENFGQVLMV